MPGMTLPEEVERVGSERGGGDDAVMARGLAPGEDVVAKLGTAIHLVVGDPDDRGPAFASICLAQKPDQLVSDQAAVVCVERPAWQRDVGENSDWYPVANGEFVGELGEAETAGFSERHKPNPRGFGEKRPSELVSRECVFRRRVLISRLGLGGRDDEQHAEGGDHEDRDEAQPGGPARKLRYRGGAATCRS